MKNSNTENLQDSILKNNSGISLRTAGIIAAVSILIMTILAPIADMGIFSAIIVKGNAQATTNNVLSSKGIFRVGIFCLFIVAVLDIVIAWSLYVLYKPVNKNVSLLTAWMRIIYAAVLIVSLNNLINMLQLLNGAEYLNSYPQKQINAQVLLNYSSYKSCWDIGLFLFGIHLTLLGVLMLKSSYTPKIIGILIILASFGYIADGTGKILITRYNINIALFTFFGEIVLIFWLFWKGIKGYKNVKQVTK